MSSEDSEFVTPSFASLVEEDGCSLAIDSVEDLFRRVAFLKDKVWMSRQIWANESSRLTGSSSLSPPSDESLLWGVKSFVSSEKQSI